MRSREEYQHNKSLNLCARCGKIKPTENSVYCESCLTKVNESRKKQREIRKSLRVCILCGSPAVNKNYCEKHKKIVKIRQHNYRRKKGILGEHIFYSDFGLPYLESLLEVFAPESINEYPQ